MYSAESIAKKRGFPRSTIYRILNEAGVRRSSALSNIRNHVNGFHNLPISDYLREVVTGELLGDLNLGYSRPLPQKEVSTEEYLKAIVNLQKLQEQLPSNLDPIIPSFNRALNTVRNFQMARFNLNISILAAPWGFHLKNIFAKQNIPLSSSIVNNSRTTVNYSGISIWSRYTIQFTELYNQWYPNGIKIVPRSIKITPTILLHWFLGDGFTMGSSIGFCTHSFSTFDVEFLVFLLNKNIGIHSHWRFDKSSTKSNQPILIIARQKDVKAFYDYLEKSTLGTLSIAKELFPWKFDGKIRKRDVMRTSRYLEALRKGIGEEVDEVYSLIQEAINRQYFEVKRKSKK